MNLQEFKAWFEGFTEGMTKAPNEKQWKRIKDRVGEITAQPTEIRYFYDHYWRPYYGPIYSYSAAAQNFCNSADNIAGVVSQNGLKCTSYSISSSNAAGSFDSTQAFKALGQADAVNL